MCILYAQNHKYSECSWLANSLFVYHQPLALNYLFVTMAAYAHSEKKFCKYLWRCNKLLLSYCTLSLSQFSLSLLQIFVILVLHSVPFCASLSIHSLTTWCPSFLFLYFSRPLFYRVYSEDRRATFPHSSWLVPSSSVFYPFLSYVVLSSIPFCSHMQHNSAFTTRFTLVD